MRILNKEDLQKLPHKFQVMFAVFCARQVIHLVKEEEVKAVCLKAIEAAEGFIEGKVSKEECKEAAANTIAVHAISAAYTAYAAAYAAANAAKYHISLYTAANAAYNAANAVGVNKEQIVKEQWDHYYELLNFEKNFEKIMLE